MAEPRDGSGIDWGLGQDLLSAALGESGLNLDEAARTDFTSEPVALPAIGNNQYNFHGNTGSQPVQENLAASESNLENSLGPNLDFNFDELSDIFDEVNLYLNPHFSSVTWSGSNDVPLSQTRESGEKIQNLDFSNVESFLGDSSFPVQSSTSTFSNFSATSLSTARTLLELASGNTNSIQEPKNAISKK